MVEKIMNRRQFLTGSSAAAIAAGLPAPVVLVMAEWAPNAIPFAGRMVWVEGTQTIRFSRVLDPLEWVTAWEGHKADGRRAINTALANYGFPTTPDRP